MALHEELNQALYDLLDRNEVLRRAANFLGPNGEAPLFSEAELNPIFAYASKKMGEYLELEKDSVKSATEVIAGFIGNILYVKPGSAGIFSPVGISQLQERYIALEILLKPENRYNYFVGNLHKERFHLQAELDLVQGIWKSAESLLAYLCVIIAPGCRYAFFEDSTEGMLTYNKILVCFHGRLNELTDESSAAQPDNINWLQSIEEFSRVIGVPEHVVTSTCRSLRISQPLDSSNREKILRILRVVTVDDIAIEIGSQVHEVAEKARELGITPPFTTYEAERIKNMLSPINRIPWKLIGGIALTVVAAVVMRRAYTGSLPASRGTVIAGAGEGARTIAAGTTVAITTSAMYPAFSPMFSRVIYTAAPGILGGFLPTGSPYFVGPRGGIFQIANGARRYL